MLIIAKTKDTDNVIGLKEEIAARLEGVATLGHINVKNITVTRQEALDALERLFDKGVEGYDSIPEVLNEFGIVHKYIMERDSIYRLGT